MKTQEAGLRPKIEHYDRDKYDVQTHLHDLIQWAETAESKIANLSTPSQLTDEKIEEWYPVNKDFEKEGEINGLISNAQNRCKQEGAKRARDSQQVSKDMPSDEQIEEFAQENEEGVPRPSDRIIGVEIGAKWARDFKHPKSGNSTLNECKHPYDDLIITNQGGERTEYCKKCKTDVTN